MDDVVVQAREHAACTADGLAHAFHAIDDVLAGDAVEEDVLLRDADVAGDLFASSTSSSVISVWSSGRRWQPRLLRLSMWAPLTPEEDIADHDIAAVFCADEGVVEAGLHGFKIDDLAFAHAA